VPDPNVTLAVSARPLPVEVVVRGHITGVTSTALWQQYAAGARSIYGYPFPDGLTKNSALPTPIITPTTKAADGGHDEPLSPADVVARGLVTPDRWEQVQAAALALFARGRAVGDRAGLILADTKYEFGETADGRLLLIDEVHTPDSSRWWVADTYAERVAMGQDPESLDKEPVRQALQSAGYAGEGDPPALAESVWADTARRYQDAYTLITGRPFDPAPYPVQDRLTALCTAGGFA
jgi:phosphoribosylaminoimidazole-succinocarboxamide synthase